MVKGYPEGFSNKREYEEFLAERMGYEDLKEYNREKMNKWNHDHGKHKDHRDNWACSQYLGIDIAENKIANKIIPILLGEIDKHMPATRHKFDFLLKSGIKVDIKARLLSYREKRIYWDFPIKYNSVADYFILIGLDNLENLNIIHIWLFKRDDLVRNRKFWNREEICITNQDYYLSKLSRFDVTKKLGNLTGLITYDE